MTSRRRKAKSNKSAVVGSMRWPLKLNCDMEESRRASIAGQINIDGSVIRCLLMVILPDAEQPQLGSKCLASMLLMRNITQRLN